MARKTKLDWLEQGLVILAEGGSPALTTDALTKRLGVTKGSFYHHFTNYEDYKLNLLSYFEQAGTHEIIALAEQTASPDKKLQRLLEVVLAYPTASSVAIRAWALQDEVVRQFQERIDKQRIDYLEQLSFEMTGDAHLAHLVAQMVYAIYVGGQQIIPPLTRESFFEIYRLIEHSIRRS